MRYCASVAKQSGTGGSGSDCAARTSAGVTGSRTPWKHRRSMRAPGDPGAAALSARAHALLPRRPPKRGSSSALLAGLVRARACTGGYRTLRTGITGAAEADRGAGRGAGVRGGGVVSGTAFVVAFGVVREARSSWSQKRPRFSGSRDSPSSTSCSVYKFVRHGDAVHTRAVQEQNTNQSETSDRVSFGAAVGSAQELWRVQARFSRESAVRQRLSVFRAAARGTAAGTCCGAEQHEAAAVRVRYRCYCCWCLLQRCRFG